ncbi:hypothetical protein B5X24_HaOG215299 [Helicoverpa armigera]|nr:hypothetical protein B5X24_HaOG215299 [Helicoverpa armigera]
MPRTYLKKKNKSYTPQDLATAIQQVRNGELTAYAAAQKYKIPMTTLHDHVKTKDTRQNAGRPKSFKAIWDAKLVEWQRRNVGTKMPKNVFAQTMADTWQQTNPEVIKSGFKKAGIYPFNAHVIPIDKYDPDAYQRYKKTLLARTLKQPKSLKEICIESFNNQFATVNETIEITGNNYVALLSAQSRNNAQMMPFEARHPSQVPTCLQNSKPTKS